MAKESRLFKVSYDVKHAAAMQALYRGNATEHQQKLVLEWIVQNACGTYDVSYISDDVAGRDSAFCEGRRFVGLQIVKLLNLNTHTLIKGKQDE